MGLFKNKNNNLSCTLIHLEGLPLAAQTSCIISLINDALIIETMNSKQRFELNISQVITIQQNANRQVTEKKKSVIKRGIAGNMLFGSTGAVVGGLSGLGTKEISQLVYDLTIVYTTNTNETNTLIFRSLNHNVCNNIIESVNCKIPEEKRNIKL